MSQEPFSPHRESVLVSRCTDYERALMILQRDFQDAPVCFFSRGLAAALARSWTRPSDDIALLNAEIDGEYAGFVLVHARGPRFWRSVVLEHPRHAARFLVAWVRTRRGRHRGPDRASGPVVDLTALNVPFKWSEKPGVAVVEFIFVRSEFRGRGVAKALLGEAERTMQRAAASVVEAHIDFLNFASVRAFQSAGWEVFRMSTGDYWAKKDLHLPNGKT